MLRRKQINLPFIKARFHRLAQPSFIRRHTEWNPSAELPSSSIVREKRGSGGILVSVVCVSK